jgi:nucleotide-binding universal stress UspA family protein
MRSGPNDAVTIVIGVNGSTTSLSALRWGCGEARRLGGRAVAVLFRAAAEQAISALSAAAECLAVGYLAPDPAGTRLPDSLAVEMLCEAADVDLDLVYAAGDQVTELRRVATDFNADLIVVSRSAARACRLVGAGGQRAAARRLGPVIVVVP